MPTPEEERKKREIFEAMSPKRQERILKKGYEKWDPFLKPKEPLAQMKKARADLERALKLYHQFFAEKNEGPSKDASYAQGVSEICKGIIRNDDRYRGMYDFCCWYRKKREDNT